MNPSNLLYVPRKLTQGETENIVETILDTKKARTGRSSKLLLNENGKKTSLRLTKTRRIIERTRSMRAFERSKVVWMFVS